MYKPNKLWVDQGRKFYNSFTQKLLDDNEYFNALNSQWT